MKKLFLLLSLTCAPLAFGQANTTYFVAASGSDGNNGTSKSTPFKNSPGMSGCSSLCAAADTALQANASGSKIILRGGDTYHYSVNTSNSTNTFMNGTWHLEHYSGGSGSCQLNELSGSIVKTTCFYTGTDPTWFSGGSFTRPIISMDNSFTTNWVSSCAHNDDANNVLFFGPYSILDDIEESGYCVGINSTSALNQQAGNMEEMSNMYIHGWTAVTETDGMGNITSGQYGMLVPSSCGSCFAMMDHNIIDGTDASDGTYTSTTGGHSTGYIGCAAATNVEFNVWRHVENGCVESLYVSIHDNLIEYMFDSGSMSTPGLEHGNVFESTDFAPTTIPVMYFYNNTMRHIGEGLGVSMSVNSGGNTYIFNNIIYDDMHSCLWVVSWGGTTTHHITNNTFGDSTCAVGGGGGGNPTSGNSAFPFENNHWIGAATSWPPTNAIPSWSSNVAGNVLMATSTATSQGYTASNNYQPTLTSNLTYQAGTNLGSSCATYSFDSSLCSSSSGGETSTASSGILSGLLVSTQPARGSTWDSGAYQFSGGNVGAPSICIGVFCTGGAFSSPQTIAITTSTGGATICYTVDGSTPTASAGSCTHGTTYSTSFSQSITGPGVTVQAIGTLSGLSNSSITSNTYTLLSVGNGVTGGTSIIGGGILVK